MQWELIGDNFDLCISSIPGGTHIADWLCSHLEIKQNQTVLSLNPKTHFIGALVAREYDANVTCLIHDVSDQALVEAASKLTTDNRRLEIVQADSLSSIPVPSETFDCVFYISSPFLPQLTANLIQELYRVIKPNGALGFAGPASLDNTVPNHMKQVLQNLDNIRLRTPAFTAISCAQHGFHIKKAEYLPEAWDRLLEFTDTRSFQDVPALQDFLKSIKEDGGRWLSLGIIILRKPLKPAWAV